MSEKTEAVGARIRRMRINMGLTLKQLSDRAGMSLQLLQRLETGTIRLNIDHLEKISGVLGVRIVDLLDERSLVEDVYRYISSNTEIALNDILCPEATTVVNLRIQPGAGSVHERPMLSDSLRMQIAKSLVDEELLSLMMRAGASLNHESLKKLKEDLKEKIDFLIYMEQNKDYDC